MMRLGGDAELFVRTERGCGTIELCFHPYAC